MNEGKIYSLIPKVMADIGAVAKSGRNEQQKYAFRGIDAFYNAAHPALIKHGVFCVPEVMEHFVESFERTNDYGKISVWRHVTLKVKHQFFADDGSHVDVITMGEGLDNSDKALNKSMSAAMKYALIELFSVPTEDVEEADRTSPEAGIAKPVVLTPKVPAKLKEETIAAPVVLPELEEESEYISTKQRSYLSKRFRESVPPEFSTRVEEYRHAALEALSRSGLFKSQFIDSFGNPTVELILKSEYERVGLELVKAARSLK